MTTRSFQTIPDFVSYKFLERTIRMHTTFDPVEYYKTHWYTSKGPFPNALWRGVVKRVCRLQRPIYWEGHIRTVQKLGSTASMLTYKAETGRRFNFFLVLLEFLMQSSHLMPHLKQPSYANIINLSILTFFLGRKLRQLSNICLGLVNGFNDKGANLREYIRSVSCLNSGTCKRRGAVVTVRYVQ